MKTIKHILLFFVFLFAKHYAFGQADVYSRVDSELVLLHKKTFSFYHDKSDSLYYYSDLFTKRLTTFIKNNAKTIAYKFSKLTDSNVCHIATSSDGLLRIYSWDTWLGGTMSNFRNIFQYQYKGKTYMVAPGKSDESYGFYCTDIATLDIGSVKYYLVTGFIKESTKVMYEFVQVYAIKNGLLDDKVKLIRTKAGMRNSISFEYDFFSVVDRPERPIRLIQYNDKQKMLRIPVVLEDGAVTTRYILYRFNGQYFEKVPSRK